MKRIIMLQKHLSRLRILPSWVILFIDILLLSLSSFISYTFFKQLGIVFYSEFPFRIRFLITLCTYSAYFLIFKTYTGIIRYSTLSDIGRLFKAIFSTFITLIAIDSVYLYFERTHIFVIYTIFYSSFFIFFTLIGFRIFVKVIFQYINKENKISSKESIAIIGVNPHNISLVETLTSPQSPFKLICFIDTNSSLNGKKVAGINILAYNKKPTISYLRWKGIKNIVLTKGYLPDDIEHKLIEDCISNDIKVYKPEFVENKDTYGNYSDTLKTYNLEELLFRETIEIKNSKVIEQFTDKTIVVTGGAGSIGSELAKQIATFNPKQLIVLDQAETPLYKIELFFKKEMPNCTCFFELTDVTNYEELESIFKKYQPEILFHAAAYKHVPLLEKNYKQAIKVNVFGTKNCIELAMKYGVKKFLYVSTDKAVNPTNIMGASKRLAEMQAQAAFICRKNNHKMQIMSTRFGNVLGSNGSVVNLFKKQIKAGGPITVTHPEVNRFFMTIPEACKLVIEAAAMGTGGQTYLFDMGRSIKIVDLAEKMIRLAGMTPYKDINIQFTGLRPGEKLYEEVLTASAETLPTYHPKIVIAKEENPCSETLDEVMLSLQNINQLERNEVINQLKIIIPGFTPYE
jgi:FlaA1/EpsC-like NDP-sugar epimerase